MASLTECVEGLSCNLSIRSLQSIKAWRSHTMEQQADRLPTGEEVCRFESSLYLHFLDQEPNEDEEYLSPVWPRPGRTSSRQSSLPPRQGCLNNRDPSFHHPLLSFLLHFSHHPTLQIQCCISRPFEEYFRNILGSGGYQDIPTFLKTTVVDPPFFLVSPLHLTCEFSSMFLLLALAWLNCELSSR